MATEGASRLFRRTKAVARPKALKVARDGPLIMDSKTVRYCAQVSSGCCTSLLNHLPCISRMFVGARRPSASTVTSVTLLLEASESGKPARVDSSSVIVSNKYLVGVVLEDTQTAGIPAGTVSLE